MGRLLARVWSTQTAVIGDAAIGLLAPMAGEHILELGFGPGPTLGRIAAARANVVGVETSRAMLRTANRYNREHVRAGGMRLYHSDGATLPLATGTMDGALGAHTLSCWSRPSAILVELARVLRPGGRLVLGLCSRQPTAAQAVEWLSAAGFADVRVERQDIAWLVAESGLGQAGYRFASADRSSTAH